LCGRRRRVYTLLDRWGTKSFAEVLQPAIDIAEQGFPLTPRPRRVDQQLAQVEAVLDQREALSSGGRDLARGRHFQNADAGAAAAQAVEAEKTAAANGRHAALQARAIASTRATREDHGHVRGGTGGLFRYDDFATYFRQVETPVSTNYRGYDVYKNASASQARSSSSHSTCSRATT